MPPNTPAMGAERTAADLRRLRRAPGRGSLCLCLQFETLVRVCVCSFVCFFVFLFVSLVGWLFVAIWFFFFVWPLGAPFWYVFFASWVIFYVCFAFVENLGLHCSTQGSVLGPLGYML